MLDYVALCLLHLVDNPSRERPLGSEDVKPRVSGHWGCVPGITRLLASLTDASATLAVTPRVVLGTGHAGAAWLAWSFYCGALAARGYPPTRDGLVTLCRDFGTVMPTEISADWPGVAWAGGALGHALGVAQGISVASPEPVVVIIGDGEFETGSTLASLLAPIEAPRARQPLVLVNLNAQRMTGSSILGRLTPGERRALVEPLGWATTEVTSSDLDGLSRQIVAGLSHADRPHLIMLRSEKGEGAPPLPDGTVTVGTPRVHKAPMRRLSTAAAVEWLDGWLELYQPQTRFNADGRLRVQSRLADHARLIVEKSGPTLVMGDAGNAGSSKLAMSNRSGKRSDASTISHGLVEIAAAKAGLVVACPDELESNQLEALRQTGHNVYEQLSEEQCVTYAMGATLAGQPAWFISYIGFMLYANPILNQHFLQISSRRQRDQNAVQLARLTIILTSLGWSNVYSHRDDSGLAMLTSLPPGLCSFLLPHDAHDIYDSLDQSGTPVECVVYDKWEPPSPPADDIDHLGVKHWYLGDASGSGSDIGLIVLGNSHTRTALEAALVLSQKTPVHVSAPTRLVLAEKGLQEAATNSIVVSSFSRAITESMLHWIPIELPSQPLMRVLVNSQDAVTAEAVRRASRCRVSDLVTAGEQLIG
ncbi:XFP N-terminal domain-containing protein [Gaiella occulta]|uniref:XFP N-terminal domain-containing protein n=2 Tax=Gaiella occulta TaxID=1002870 RepID=A0A7M2YTQ8_9ACTN|nr:XFP N-terminal domain-containing protein [Gaiella occulta]